MMMMKMIFWSNCWNEFGRGNQSTRRKPAPAHFVDHKIPHDDPVSNAGPQRWEASDLPLELWRGLLSTVTSVKQYEIPLIALLFYTI
jgi:hypothetical protein